jgi:hypothetical protein
LLVRRSLEWRRNADLEGRCVQGHSSFRFRRGHRHNSVPVQHGLLRGTGCLFTHARRAQLCGSGAPAHTKTLSAYHRRLRSGHSCAISSKTLPHSPGMRASGCMVRPKLRRARREAATGKRKQDCGCAPRARYSCTIPPHMEPVSSLQMPIGLDYHTAAGPQGWVYAERQTPGSQEADLLSIGKTAPPFWDRRIHCYSNFHHSIHWDHPPQYVSDRIAAKEGIQADCIEYADKCPRIDCWKRMAEVAFIPSPHGNGLDCHRTWEVCAPCVLAPTLPAPA